jgi:hypothetical protein
LGDQRQAYHVGVATIRTNLFEIPSRMAVERLRARAS